MKFCLLSVRRQDGRAALLLLLAFLLILPCLTERIISASLEVVGIKIEEANTLEFQDHFKSALSVVADIPYSMITVGTAEPARSTRQVLSLQSRLLLEKTLRIPYTVSLSAIGDDDVLTTTSPLYKLSVNDNDEEALKVGTYLSSASIREGVKTKLGVLLQISPPPATTKSSTDVGNEALTDRIHQLRQQRLLTANTPTGQPSNQPTMEPTQQPSSQPSAQPVMRPSGQPSRQPSSQPSRQPSRQPSSQPSRQPSGMIRANHYITFPSFLCCFLFFIPCSSAQPTMEPTRQPSSQPSAQPVMRPSSQPSRYVFPLVLCFFNIPLLALSIFCSFLSFHHQTTKLSALTPAK